MTLQTFSVLYYTNRDYKDMTFGLDSQCEAVCREICKELRIKPKSNLLFSLRANGSNFLPGNTYLQANEKYEFRFRHQVPNLSDLMKIDKHAYNYYYHQAKYDLIHNSIPELQYPNHKERVVVLAVTSLYHEHLENRDFTLQVLMRNYKDHLPKKHIEKHRFRIKDQVSENLNSIMSKEHDIYYVKSRYTESINDLAKNYLIERYVGIMPYEPDDNFPESRECKVDVEFQPFHVERPGLSVKYSYKSAWMHVAKIEDIFAIIIDKENKKVKLEIRDCPATFCITIEDEDKLHSFVSCIVTYYRLMEKWTIDLCRDMCSPMLGTLMELKCHGPIGGEYAYMKLQNQNCTAGSYIIRQCEKIYDTYYIDIVIKPKHFETYKITQRYDTWHLHLHDGLIKQFDNLTDLAKSIKTQSKQKLRLAPSAYDKSTSLLLCMPPYQITAKQFINEHSENELRKKRAQIFDPVKDFRKYQNSQKLIENGLMIQMRAEWILPEDKKLDVTLKILNSQNHLAEFMSLAEKWSNFDSSEFIKMYGFILTTPNTIVLESFRVGQLNDFLQIHQMPPLKLIEASYTLARALHYLQEKNFVHGRIRCASLYVVRHDKDNFVVRLGDPGLLKPYTDEDIPWIPIEHYQNMERAKMDLKAEIWAYATTLWEIFSRGRTPTHTEFSRHNRRLPQPQNCPLDIYNIIRDGWNDSPDKRYSPQGIFPQLLMSRDRQLRHYSVIDATLTLQDDNQSLLESICSTQTAETKLMTNGRETPVHMRSGSTSSNDTMSSISNHMGNENTPLLNDTESERTIASDYYPIDVMQTVLDLNDGGKLIFQGKIGNGNYGSVYKGQYENDHIDNSVKQVAIKLLKPIGISVMKDFEREINIMKKLQHPNIVQIITSYHDNDVFLIVMEYVKHLSFLMYLSSQRPSLTTLQLLKFAKDIAKGMEYLVSKKVVHRDLAARNILVDIDECVKISDFGLAQDANPNGYYAFQTQRDIPIKWYAPEVQHSNKYSFASDVWSYGMTLFEMFSGGQQPNLVPGKELDPTELLNRLQNGDRLAKPPECPESVYNSLMLVCWDIDPKKRPSFTQILQIINLRIAEHGEGI